MPYFTDYDGNEIEVDVYEFLSECSGSEVDTLIDALIDDGYIKDSDRISDNTMSISEFEFEEALDKLHNKWNRLSKEDELAIIAIANKF